MAGRRYWCLHATYGVAISRRTATVAPCIFDAQPVHVVAPDIVVHLLFHGFLTLDALRDHLIVLFHGHRLSHLCSQKSENTGIRTGQTIDEK